MPEPPACGPVVLTPATPPPFSAILRNLAHTPWFAPIRKGRRECHAAESLDTHRAGKFGRVPGVRSVRRPGRSAKLTGQSDAVGAKLSVEHSGLKPGGLAQLRDAWPAQLSAAGHKQHTHHGLCPPTQRPH